LRDHVIEKESTNHDVMLYAAVAAALVAFTAPTFYAPSVGVTTVRMMATPEELAAKKAEYEANKV
jgi:hypothetical protein